MTTTLASGRSSDRTNVLARTRWTKVFRGDRLSHTAHEELRRKAHILYEANTHIFEDEREALVALGALPEVQLAV
jgi:hypothetical protein